LEQYSFDVSRIYIGLTNRVTSHGLDQVKQEDLLGGSQAWFLGALERCERNDHRSCAECADASLGENGCRAYVRAAIWVPDDAELFGLSNGLEIRSVSVGAELAPEAFDLSRFAQTVLKQRPNGNACHSEDPDEDDRIEGRYRHTVCGCLTNRA